MRRLIPWHRIGHNLREGHLESLSVTATDIGSGKTVVFVQNASGQIPAWSQDPFVRAQSVTMGAEHALASAALPILFPAISIGERFFCDGGLRQNTPLSPALRLGADKVLVIGLRHKPPANESVPEESMPFPGRRVPGRQDPGRLPAGSHRLRPRSAAPLQRPDRRRARDGQPRPHGSASTRW